MISDQYTLLINCEDDTVSEGFNNITTSGSVSSVSDIPLQSTSFTCNARTDEDSVQSTLIQTKRERDLAPDLVLPDGKEAHFFVSYSSEDSSRVLPIVAKLEKDHNCACIIHERDFNPGMEIHENINRFMEKSMKILLFLSEKFLESGYCKHEKNLAFVMSMEADENKIIPVLIDEHCKVPSSLKTLTYIKMNADDVTDKIMAAYNFKDFDILPVEFGQVGARRLENGYTIRLPCEEDNRTWKCRPQGQKVIFGLEQMWEVRRGNFKVSEETIKEAVGIVNSHVTSNLWTRSSESFSCCLGCYACPFIFLVVFFVIAVLFLFIHGQHISRQTSDFELRVLEVILPLTFIGSLATCCEIYCSLSCRRKKETLRIIDEIFNITLKTYKDGVLFKVDERFGEITILLIRYDIKPCQRYLARKIRQKDESNSEAGRVDSTDIDYDERATKFIEQKLRYLLNVNAPPAPEIRHNVRDGKSCYCQILEAYIDKS